MILVTLKLGRPGHPFLGTDARSKEQEKRSLEQVGRSHPPSPRSWEPMGRSLELLNHSKEQADRSLERTNRSKAATAHSHERTNPALPIPRASDADRDAIAALVQKCLDAKAVPTRSAHSPSAGSTTDPNADVNQFEAEMDARVEFLYFHQSEAPSYDEWRKLKPADTNRG